MVSLATGPFESSSQVWRRVIFLFKNFSPVQGSIRNSPGPGKAISGSLPIISEAIVLDNIEIMIKLPPTFKTRLNKRFHTAEPGDIVYRPQIPALSIFADYFDVYEPVERIGTIMREDRDKINEIVKKATGLLFVKIIKAGSEEKVGENEEKT